MKNHDALYIQHFNKKGNRCQKWYFLEGIWMLPSQASSNFNPKISRLQYQSEKQKLKSKIKNQTSEQYCIVE
jgi:hypothetical protein